MFNSFLRDFQCDRRRGQKERRNLFKKKLLSTKEFSDLLQLS